MRVLVSGIKGRMGSLVATTVQKADDMELVGGVDPKAIIKNFLSKTSPFYDDSEVPLFEDLDAAIKATNPDCVIDFSLPSAVFANITSCINAGINCVVGTTGLSSEHMNMLASLLGKVPKSCVFIAPNFTIGAVLMMRFAQMAAAYFPDAEVLEFHHNGKVDAPSGTATSTAKMIAQIRTAHDIKSKSPGSESELEGLNGARGAILDGVAIHSIRSNAFMASQEVLFGSTGERLSIRHDSTDRNAYMPGVLLAVRAIKNKVGLIVGLENLMDI
ncbi:MAG: 4-hydroxy-tetrahydrodipicolinate reductase [Coriobacteriales bacterium]|jgi:4-hydroxy-tetrahydrodipicolinate reductase|nr:4-hydroxy-tetrahydrodipicolinate reductase [Coriobacteriales bacterium]